MYDFFYQKRHPAFLEKIFLRSSLNILSVLLQEFPLKKSLSFLELGPGKGYFLKAIKESKIKISYTAVDQNELVLKNITTLKKYKSTLPKLPKFYQKFDCIYGAYLIEHLKSGDELYELILNCKKYLKKGGIISFLAPDVLDQKFEFYAADYTHQYPVTKRNVSLIFQDIGFTNLVIYEGSDLCFYLTSNPSFWKPILWLSKLLLFFYNYHLFSFIFSPIYKNKDYELDNWFYRFYSFTKVKNLLFIAKNE
ncbi:methyltransferase domain-containing protein [Candidatus Gottesmanbacteria bacterium]|nr:methyltransferase domain-containing protein [Candidatus Gottesmanbacteria bacterium]